jgi:hypothetical protein
MGMRRSSEYTQGWLLASTSKGGILDTTLGTSLDNESLDDHYTISTMMASTIVSVYQF